MHGEPCDTHCNACKCHLTSVGTGGWSRWVGQVGGIGGGDRWEGVSGRDAAHGSLQP